MGLLDTQLEGMRKFNALAELRAKYANDPEMQARLAPLEHGQFAENLTHEDPLNAIALAAATPAYFALKTPALYDVSKRLGLIGQDATPADYRQVNESFKGIGRGLLNADWSNTGGTLKNAILNRFR